MQQAIENLNAALQASDARVQALELNSRTAVEGLQAQLTQTVARATQAEAEVRALQARPTGPPADHARDRPAVDTRSFGRLETFMGDRDAWTEWALIFRGYCAAYDPELRAAMSWAEKQAIPLHNGDLSVERKKHSNQLYFFLLMWIRDTARTRISNVTEGD